MGLSVCLKASPLVNLVMRGEMCEVVIIRGIVLVLLSLLVMLRLIIYYIRGFVTLIVKFRLQRLIMQ